MLGKRLHSFPDMNFSLVIDKHHASGAVHSYGLSDDGLRFAAIRLTDDPGKRSRSQSQKTRPAGCCINLSIWKPAANLHSRSLGKSFVHIYDFNEDLRSWRTATILAIRDVTHTPTLVRSTYLAISLVGKRNRHGIALCRVSATDAEIIKILKLDKETKSAVLLRGPSLLATTSSGLLFFDCEGKETSLDAGADRITDSEDIAICNLDDETSALLCNVSRATKKSLSIDLFYVKEEGKITHLFEIQTESEERPASIAATPLCDFLVLSTLEGGLYGVSILSQSIIWQCVCPKNVIKKPHSISFYHNFVLFASGESEDIFTAELSSYLNKPPVTAKVKPLFSRTCETSAGRSHTHLFVIWKNSLLKVNSTTGVCCDETDANEQINSAGSRSDHDNPSLPLIERNLEGRLQTGIDRFLEIEERIRDKRQMFDGLCSLLATETRSIPQTSFPVLFKNKLQPFASLPIQGSNSAPDTHSSKDAQPERDYSDMAQDETNAKSDDFVNLVKIVHSRSQLDWSKNYIVIHTQIVYLKDGIEETLSTPQLRARLQFQCGERMNSVWEYEQIWITENADTYVLRATAPLAVFTSSSKFSELVFNAKIVFSNGQSQLVGFFTIASILSSKEKKESVGRRNHNCLNNKLHLVGTGMTVAQFERISKTEDFVEYAIFRIQEHLVRITLYLASQNELVMLLARLTTEAGDKVKFQGSPEPSRGSLHTADTGLILLEEEMKCVRKIGSQKNAFGYSADEISQILQCQIELDDAFGLIEEQQLWL